MQGSKTIKLVDTKDFELHLEYSKDFVVLHAPRVDRMTKEVFFELHSYIEDVNGFVTFQGYSALHAAVPTFNSQGRKLAETFGFEYIGTSGGYDVFEYGEV